MSDDIYLIGKKDGYPETPHNKIGFFLFSVVAIATPMLIAALALT